MASRAHAPQRLLVASGKGGVGTSMVAALTALSAAEGDRRVLLVDACEGAGTLHHLFGLRPARSVWTLGAGAADAREVLIPIHASLTLVAGGMSGDAVTPRNDAER